MMDKSDEDCFQIQGQDFYGEININNNDLTIEINSLRDQMFYTAQITNEDLQKQSKDYIVFRQIKELFDEIRSNQYLEVTVGSQGFLRIPIQITYKNRKIELKIDIPLTLRQFKDQAQKIKTIFKEVKKIYQQNNYLKRKLRKCSQIIDFQPDKRNMNYKSYEMNNNMIKKVGQRQEHTTLNHMSYLPRKGIFHFKTKIIKSPTKYIFVGICGKDIKSVVNSHHSPYFMGLYLPNASIYGNNTQPKPVILQLSIVEESVIKVEINMNKKEISWYINQSHLCTAQIWKQLTETDIYPIINLWAQGDIIEMINQ